MKLLGRNLKIIALLLSGLLFFFLFSDASASVPRKRILILFPYENNLPGFISYNAGLRSSLQASREFRFDFYSENLDLLRFPEEGYYSKLVELLEQKYSGLGIDLVVVVLSPALDFVMQHRDRLFPGAPVILAEFDTSKLRDGTLKPDINVVTCKLDMKQNMALALTLHPDARKVFVVAGISEMDRSLEAEARHAFRDFGDRVDFSTLSGLSMEETIRRISKLPDHSVVFYLAIFRDSEKRSFLPPEALALLSEKANAPIYGLSETFVGSGIVGGYIASFSGWGVRTAQSALRLLGSGDSDIKEAVDNDSNRYIFDWRQLRRWKISEASLPPGSIVQFRESSLWENYKRQIVTIAVIFVLQSLLITALVINLRRRRQAERALRESEARLSLAASSADLGLWTLEIATGDIWVTDKTRELYGISPSEKTDFERFIRIVHPENRDEIRQAVKQTLETGEDFRAQYRIVLPDRRVRRIAAHARLHSAPSGKQTHLMGVSTDITERMEAEAEAGRRREELAHVTRIATMGELATSLAHEINQPLTAILTNAQAAQRFLTCDDPDLNEVRQILDDIVRDDNRASDVIRRVRALLRKETVPNEPVDLNDVIEESLALIRSDALLDGLSVTTELDRELPAIQADRVGLQQVILNLILNAIDAMRTVPSASRKLTVKTAAKDNGAVRVSVADSGIGLDSQDIDRLFDPFYTTKPEGMGMGLSISRTIITAHGGKLGAENNPEGGAVFYFTLPLDRGGRS